MPYFVIERDPSRFPFGAATSVRADAVDPSDPMVVRLSRGGQTCFRAPASDVIRVTEHPSHLEAEEHLKKLRRWRSGGRLHVHEATGTTRAPRKRSAGETAGGSAVPAEGLTFRIEET